MPISQVKTNLIQNGSANACTIDLQEFAIIFNFREFSAK